MTKKTVALLIALVASISLIACGGSDDSSSTDTTDDTTEEQSTDDEQEEEATEEEVTYGVGDTWEVEGQWTVTVNSVTESDYRNEYEESEPAATYVVNYTYENLGYEDESGLMDGLYIDFESGQIVDSAGTMGYSYPGDISDYAQEVPVGANVTAEACIGVDNAGSFTITLNEYDGSGESQSATFEMTVE